MDTSDDFCAICLCRKRRAVSIPCKHTFCKNCLKKAYHSCDSKTCPLCRAPIKYYIQARRSNIKIVFLA